MKNLLIATPLVLTLFSGTAQAYVQLKVMYPANGANFPAETSIGFSISDYDPYNLVVSTALHVDLGEEGVKIFEAEQKAKYVYANWPNPKVGTYNAFAQATLEDGSTVNSLPVALNVLPYSDEVLVVSPENNAQFHPNDQITHHVVTTLPDTDIQKVTLVLNGFEFNTHFKPPYVWPYQPGKDANAQNNFYGQVTTHSGDVYLSRAAFYRIDNICAPAWSALTEYQQGDKVNHEGMDYQAKWWSMGDKPSNTSGDHDVWKAIEVCY